MFVNLGAFVNGNTDPWIANVLEHVGSLDAPLTSATVVYRLMADAVVVVHFGFILFVALGACSPGGGLGWCGCTGRPWRGGSGSWPWASSAR